MATCSRILAWEIPGTEEPAGLYRPWGCRESDMTEHAHTCRAEERLDCLGLCTWSSKPSKKSGPLLDTRSGRAAQRCCAAILSKAKVRRSLQS